VSTSNQDTKRSVFLKWHAYLILAFRYRNFLAQSSALSATFAYAIHTHLCTGSKLRIFLMNALFVLVSPLPTWSFYVSSSSRCITESQLCKPWSSFHILFHFWLYHRISLSVFVTFVCQMSEFLWWTNLVKLSRCMKHAFMTPLISHISADSKSRYYYQK
jgi:hypothetical protein